MTTSHQQSEAAAHDDPVAPAQHRFGKRVQLVIEPILVLEERSNVTAAETAIGCAGTFGRRLGLVHFPQIAPGTECPFTCRGENDHCHPTVCLPPDEVLP